MGPLSRVIKHDIAQALGEDLGSGDITAQLIDVGTQLDVLLLCREQAVLCGRDWFEAAFKQLDASITFNWFANDGDKLIADSVVCEITGNARAVLSAERTALNFLQTLSATATLTRRYQQAIAGTGCKILDTRKTIPGLRQAQKYAVTCGGGTNHRIGLFDAFLLKENHLSAAGSIASAVKRARALHPEALLEVEVETLDQLQQAVACKVDRVLLDNFSLADLRRAVELNAGTIELEASGNITLDNIRAVAECGVDYISTGALTKNVQAIDFSLRYRD